VVGIGVDELTSLLCTIAMVSLALREAMRASMTATSATGAVVVVALIANFL
jgi:hypothetical protein